MAQPEAPQMTIAALLKKPVAWTPGILNAQAEFHEKLEELRDAVADAIWDADAEGYISPSDAINDPTFAGHTRDAIVAYVEGLIDAGKFAVIDAIMARVDQAEENYDPDDEDDEDEG